MDCRLGPAFSLDLISDIDLRAHSAAVTHRRHQPWDMDLGGADLWQRCHIPTI